MSTRRPHFLPRIVDDVHARRALLHAGTVLVTYFEASIPMPAGWERRPCSYLLFSADPYGRSAADARHQGWPVLELRAGHHLALVTDPTAVADALLQLERELLEDG
jgi:hypothetical protein